MTKTQVKILELGKKSEEVSGIRRYLLRLFMFFLEILVTLHRIVSTFYRGKDSTFQTFAGRDEQGSYTESFTDHEKFRRASVGSVALAVIMAVIYVSSGIFIPNQVAIHAATYTVNQLDDAGDGLCDSTCTLRDAILNSNSTIGVADAITFDSAGTIALSTPLPTLTDQLTIDGDVNGNGTPDVVLNGTGISGDGITIASDNNAIQGLVIQNFGGNGISIQGSSNIITGNYIGTNSAGTAQAANTGNGVTITDDGVTPSENNIIGGSNATARNIISGNGAYGVLLTGSNVENNTVAGNYVGLNASGAAAIANTNSGIATAGDAHDNMIGGDLGSSAPGTAPGNVISGNTESGVLIASDTDSHNQVAGNIIGLDAAGTTAIPNHDGIAVGGNASTIGGESNHFRNIISGNADVGVSVAATGVTVANNYIGTDITGATAKANNKGIRTSGGLTVANNVISGNPTGIFAGGALTVTGNKIGTNAAGTAAVSGSASGVFIAGGTATIGGTSAEDRNIISGNTSFGVAALGAGAHATIQGNYIGTDVNGTAAIPNDLGVALAIGNTGSVIGGNNTTTSCSGPCNVISGNTTNDVKIDSNAHDNFVKGNYIGINAAGTRPLVWNQADSKVSLLVNDGSYNNQIGGTRDENIDELGDGNVISGNQETSNTGTSGAAVQISGYNGTNGNTFFGNLVGTSPAGTFQDSYNNTTGASGADGINDFRNLTGVRCLNSPYCLIGDGTSGHANLISGNAIGVEFNNSPHSSINQNYIGTDKTGSFAFSTSDYQGQSALHYGVYLKGGDDNTGIEVKNNTISGFYHENATLPDNLREANFGMALVIGNEGFIPSGEVQAGTISGNKIGTDKTGTTAIKNNVGIYCYHASHVTIGGANAADRNIISGNGENGVGGPFVGARGEIGRCGENTIQGNYFGTTASGNAALGNGNAIELFSGSIENTWEGNVIAASGKDGIKLENNENDTIANNKIGVGADGTTALPNTLSGLAGASTSASIIQGNTIARNLIAGIDITHGAQDFTISHNTIKNNVGNGVQLSDATHLILTDNTIQDNGDNGIILINSTLNQIGETGGHGNTLSGHRLNGIALTTNSNGNHVDANTVTDNGDEATTNGAGIYINESSDNVLSENALNTNVRGLAITSSDTIGSQNNSVASGTINQNLSSGVLLQDPLTQANTLSGNTISGNHAYGIDSADTHAAGATTSADGDNTLSGNIIKLNILSGIRNFGASPKIISNTISQNSVHGIYNVVDYGSSTSPDTESDDVLSTPEIGGTDHENTINTNAQFGIYSVDTAPSNKIELITENTFDALNASGRVRQDWYGLVQATKDNVAEQDATVKVYGHASTDPFTEFTTASTGYGPKTAALTDAQTWQLIPEYVVSPSGTLQDFTPQLIIGTGSAGATTFSFNGETLSGSSDFGNIHGRYQVASVVLAPNPNTIQGTVFNDANKNKTNDSEAGLTNVQVRVYRDDGSGTLGSEDALVDTTTTNTSGAYTIGNIPNGSYFVKATSPTDFEATTDNPSSIVSFTATDGGQTSEVNFGFATTVMTTPSGTINGTVFVDANKNKIKDTGETGFADITLHLFTDTNADEKFDEGTDQEKDTSTSSSTGTYSFNNVALGTYFVRYTVPVNYTATSTNPSEEQVLDTDGQTQTVNFGLVGTTVVIPPVVTPPVPPPTPIQIIAGATKTPIAGVLAPRTGVNTANTAAASTAAGVGLLNLLLATPGAAWPAFMRLLSDLFTEPLLALFGSRKLPWGRLFNALTKRPIDLGLVRLYDSQTRTLVGTAVTDATGRFKFLPKPGLYTARASKGSYSFPSTLLTVAPTYEKKNLYFGGQIRIDENNQTFTKDIPLDPPEASKDTKQVVKLRAKQTIHTVVAFSGIAVSVVNVILLATPITIGLLGLHVILLIVFWRMALPAKPKPWGRVYSAETNKPVKGAIVRIYDQRFGRLLDTAITDKNGRYGFLVGAQDYTIAVEAIGYTFPAQKKNANDYVGGPLHVAHENAAVSADLPLKPTE